MAKRRRYTRETRVAAHGGHHDGLHGRIAAHHGVTDDGEPLYEVQFDSGNSAGILRESELTREPVEKGE